jgi:hypothetical protein
MHGAHTSSVLIIRLTAMSWFIVILRVLGVEQGGTPLIFSHLVHSDPEVAQYAQPYRDTLTHSCSEYIFILVRLSRVWPAREARRGGQGL